MMEPLDSLSAFARLAGRTPWSRFLLALGLITVVAQAATVPDAPRNVVATPANTYASVAFLAPSNDGGSPILGYTAIAQPGNITVTGSVSPLTVTGLTNGSKYTFKVYATNALGNSPFSAASDTVIPKIPVAPGIVFEQSVYVDTLNVAVSLIPTIWGTLTSCAVYPNLPLGLRINSSDCSITGTPRIATAASDYSVVASNGSSYSTYVLTLTIVAPPSALAAFSSPAMSSRNFGIPENVLPSARRILVSIRNAHGERIRNLRFGENEILAKAITWDGLDEQGGRTPRGMYLMRSEVEAQEGTRVYFGKMFGGEGPRPF